MEYCNRGSLQTAVPRGVFQRVDADGTTRPNRLNILTTAAQLAEAMAYVHSQVLCSRRPLSTACSRCTRACACTWAPCLSRRWLS